MKIGVIGCGLWGQNLIRNFNQLEALGGICDQDFEKARFISSLYKVPVLSWQEMLSNPSLEGIVIATSAPSHFSLALDCLRARKHLFLEKPATLCVQEMKTLIQEKEASLIFMVGHLLRYHPAFQVVQEHVNHIGKPLFIDAYRHNFGRLCPWEKNVFWSLSPHDLSMVLALSQEMPNEISVMAENLYTRADQGVIQLKFPSGLMAKISASWIAPFKEQRLILIGTQGTIVFNDALSKDKVMFYPHTLGDTSIKQGDPCVFPYDSSEPLLLECRHFIESITNQKTPITHELEALQVIEILERTDYLLDSRRPYVNKNFSHCSESSNVKV